MLVVSLPAPPDGASALPYGLGGLAVLAVSLWLVKQFLGEMINEVSRRAFGLLTGRGARRRGFGRRALRDYRDAVRSGYATHTLGFSDGDAPIRIEDVYVALQYESADRRADVYDRIQTERRSVVVGDPGAGKSMLLKKSMLTWAAGRPDPTVPVPVLVELHRANAAAGSLEDLVLAQLVLDQLGEDGPALRATVRRELREGRLQVLFDGLDEVGAERRTAVERGLADFARLYPRCHLVVTCRKAVYTGQLAEWFPHLVTVAEFDDASIRQLLRNWRQLSAAAAEELFASLRENPPLLRLARNPLLLTMIVYLHVNVSLQTGQALPSSRAMFYDLAIDHLLRRDVRLHRGGPPLALFPVAQKQAVLQRVALALQEQPGEGTDQLTVSLSELRALVAAALPDLNIGPERAGVLLDEIIERSQLLVPVDRGRTRHQFRHLTLREYLAARELVDDPDRLLAGHRADPAGWRETVKLWCAQTSRDSTPVIRAILDAGGPDQVLALECLVEAGRVQETYAREIVRSFQDRLGAGDAGASAVEAAFGAVAADDRPRGREVRAMLTDMVHRPDVPRSARVAAMRALSASGRLDATATLAALATEDEDARAALTGTGELAIPALAGRARVGDRWAVDELARIGTPAAAEQLAGLLWSSPAVEVRAAWRLAALFRRPGVEEAIAKARLVVDAQAPWSTWTWRPFGDPDGILGRVAGRIVYLLDTGSAAPRDLVEIDPRLGLPVAAWRAVGRAPGDWTVLVPPPERGPVDLAAPDTRSLLEAIGERVDLRLTGLGGPAATLHRTFLAVAAAPAAIPEGRELGRLLLERQGVHDHCTRVVELLPWRVGATFLAEYLGAANFTPRTQDWLAVRTPPPREPVVLRGLIRILVALAAALVLWALVTHDLGSIFWSVPWGPEWVRWSWTVGAVAAVVAFFLSLDLDAREGVFWAALLFLAAYLARAVLLAWLQLAAWTTPTVATVVGLALAGLIAALSSLARARESAVANPLRRCLDADDHAGSSRLSVLTSRGPAG